MPNFAAIYMIATLSSLGLPLLNGFIGEFTILSGVYQVSLRFAAWAVIGIILGAAYLLWLYQRVMFGPVTNPANEHLPDLNAREYATLIPLVLLAFWIGIYPKPLFTVLEGPVRQIVQQVNPGYYNAERVGTAPQATLTGAPAVVNLPAKQTVEPTALATADRDQAVKHSTAIESSESKSAFGREPVMKSIPPASVAISRLATLAPAGEKR